MAKRLSYYDPRIVEWRDELRREQHSRLLRMILKSRDNVKKRCMGILSHGEYCMREAKKGEGGYCKVCSKRHNR